jgi:hypothetical protein
VKVAVDFHSLLCIALSHSHLSPAIASFLRDQKVLTIRLVCHRTTISVPRRLWFGHVIFVIPHVCELVWAWLHVNSIDSSEHFYYLAFGEVCCLDVVAVQNFGISALIIDSIITLRENSSGKQLGSPLARCWPINLGKSMPDFANLYWIILVDWHDFLFLLLYSCCTFSILFFLIVDFIVLILSTKTRGIWRRSHSILKASRTNRGGIYHRMKDQFWSRNWWSTN